MKDNENQKKTILIIFPKTLVKSAVIWIKKERNNYDLSSRV